MHPLNTSFRTFSRLVALASLALLALTLVPAPAAAQSCVTGRPVDVCTAEDPSCEAETWASVRAGTLSQEFCVRKLWRNCEDAYGPGYVGTGLDWHPHLERDACLWAGSCADGTAVKVNGQSTACAGTATCPMGPGVRVNGQTYCVPGVPGVQGIADCGTYGPGHAGTGVVTTWGTYAACVDPGACGDRIGVRLNGGSPVCAPILPETTDCHATYGDGKPTPKWNGAGAAGVDACVAVCQRTPPTGPLLERLLNPHLGVGFNGSCFFAGDILGEG